MSRPATSGEALGKLQRDTFGYFLKETNLQNGLVPDNTRRDAHCSVAAVGLRLAAYRVGAERGFITRAEAVRRTLTTLRVFLGVARKVKTGTPPAIESRTTAQASPGG